MFRVGHDFHFTLNDGEKPVRFNGQLIFKDDQLNEFGSLHSEDDITNFNNMLAQSVNLSMFSTLELLTKELFDGMKPLFRNLVAVNLSLHDAPHRTVEYSIEEGQDILELPEMVH